jgi:hypothetical protein
VKAQPPEATLVDLYQHQRCSLNQIAHRVGCNEKIIARLACMYVTHRRTLTDLAREVA